ncbi:MAG TPA: conjugal transfer protein TraB, partial [Thermoplasmatales archaeon]|nr:conjugal transfer protein TraB [Thermoplasmatales archaeon]
MITLVGTGHVFDLSMKVEQIIRERLPDVVCVELDITRYNALVARGNNETISRKSLPAVYRLLAKFQDTVADWYGVEAGDEMLTAIKTANEMDIPVELIDMDAQKVFKRMWKSMSLRERFRLLVSALFGLFSTRSMIEREIEKIQNNMEQFMEVIGKKFPTVKRVLIDERDRFMAERLEELCKNYENIVAFVGDGHIPGIKEKLLSRNIEVEVLRLKDITKKKKNN